jgi:hypothetical protein
MAQLKDSTINGNPVWHAGNDGAGSGLDADTLDGQHGSYYYSPANPPSTSFTTLTVGTTAQRPVSPADGYIRKNNTTNKIEYYNSASSSWINLLDDRIPGVEPSNPATSATQILQANSSAGSGYYYIKPNAGTTYYVYCDMVTDGGGWMLMINARPNNGGQYYNSNDFGLSTINGNTTVEFNKSTTSMFGVSKINDFFAMSGFKYGRMTPGPGVSINAPFTGLYQRIGTTTSAAWGGSAFECSNRTNLTGSQYSWVLTQYKNWSDVVNNLNARVGTYTGPSHWYPTTYDNAWQNFWKGDQDGLRFSSTFDGENYAAIGQNTSPGYWWIKTT